MTVPKRRGRQQIYDQKIVDLILERLADGEQLDTICADPGMPAASTVRGWALEDYDRFGRDGFANRYARARSIGYEKMVAEILAISDAPCIGPDGTADNALVQKQRLQTDSRKWLLSKLLPKQFGDKITQELTSDPDAPVITRIELVPVDPVMRAATALPKRRDGGPDGG